MRQPSPSEKRMAEAVSLPWRVRLRIQPPLPLALEACSLAKTKNCGDRIKEPANAGGCGRVQAKGQHLRQNRPLGGRRRRRPAPDPPSRSHLLRKSHRAHQARNDEAHSWMLAAGQTKPREMGGAPPLGVVDRQELTAPDCAIATISGPSHATPSTGPSKPLSFMQASTCAR